jgi:hypothetical protein
MQGRGVAMARRDGLELRTSIARALRWAERTAALARESTAGGRTRDAVRDALLATEDLARRVEARQRVLLKSSRGTPARGE